MQYITTKYNDRTKDILYSILLSLGGTDMDIKPLFLDERDDLLYAILEKLQPDNQGISPFVERFSQDELVRIAAGKSIGRFINGDTFPLNNLTPKQAILLAISEPVAPVYVMPTGTLISNPVSNNATEVGTPLAISLSGSFVQNDAGSLSLYELLKNGSVFSNAQLASDNISAPLIPTTYQARFTYLQGAIKNNNLGQPDPTGRIQAGSVNSAQISFRGYYRLFFGPVAQVPANSGDVRVLPSQLTSQGLSFTLNTGAIQTRFVLAIPPGRNLVSVVDQDALNLDITSQYVQAGSISVNDAGGQGHQYTLFVMTMTVPYNTNHRHNVTIQ